MMDEPEVDFVSRVGGAILLAETQWTPKDGVSKERAMALAALEAMREPTKEMVLAGNDAARDHMEMDGYESTGFYPVADPGLAVAALTAMIDAAISRNQNGG